MSVVFLVIIAGQWGQKPLVQNLNLVQDGGQHPSYSHLNRKKQLFVLTMIPLGLIGFYTMYARGSIPEQKIQMDVPVGVIDQISDTSVFSKLTGTFISHPLTGIFICGFVLRVLVQPIVESLLGVQRGQIKEVFLEENPGRLQNLEMYANNLRLRAQEREHADQWIQKDEVSSSTAGEEFWGGEIQRHSKKTSVFDDFLDSVLIDQDRMIDHDSVLMNKLLPFFQGMILSTKKEPSKNLFLQWVNHVSGVLGFEGKTIDSSWDPYWVPPPLFSGGINIKWIDHAPVHTPDDSRSGGINISCISSSSTSASSSSWNYNPYQREKFNEHDFHKNAVSDSDHTEFSNSSKNSFHSVFSDSDHTEFLEPIEAEALEKGLEQNKSPDLPEHCTSGTDSQHEGSPEDEIIVYPYNLD